MRHGKALAHGLAAAAVALPVALANPTAVRSCGGGPQLNAPGATPTDKRESESEEDPFANEPLPGLDDDKIGSTPAPVEPEPEESAADNKPSGFESAEAEDQVSDGGTQASEDKGVATKRGLKFTYTPRYEYTYDDHLNPGPTAASLDGSSTQESWGFPIPPTYFDVSSALNRIEQGKGGPNKDPSLSAAYSVVESYLGVFHEEEDDLGSQDIKEAVAKDMSILRLPASDPKRIALISRLRGEEIPGFQTLVGFTAQGPTLIDPLEIDPATLDFTPQGFRGDEAYFRKLREFQESERKREDEEKRAALEYLFNGRSARNQVP